MSTKVSFDSKLENAITQLAQDAGRIVTEKHALEVCSKIKNHITRYTNQLDEARDRLWKMSPQYSPSVNKSTDSIKRYVVGKITVNVTGKVQALLPYVNSGKKQNLNSHQDGDFMVHKSIPSVKVWNSVFSLETVKWLSIGEIIAHCEKVGGRLPTIPEMDLYMGNNPDWKGDGMYFAYPKPNLQNVPPAFVTSFEEKDIEGEASSGSNIAIFSPVENKWENIGDNLDKSYVEEVRLESSRYPDWAKLSIKYPASTFIVWDIPKESIDV